MLDEGERGELLRVARAAIDAGLAGRSLGLGPACGALARNGGAFVSLHRRADGELRGCIGSVEGLGCVRDTVVWSARAAATQDRRFVPVQASELPGLAIEVSVLTTPQAIEPGAVVVGRHGLLVRHGDRSGLLLPQVALERRWDKEQYLSLTCRKAGLAENTWRLKGCEILAFEAEVFAD